MAFNKVSTVSMVKEVYSIGNLIGENCSNTQLSSPTSTNDVIGQTDFHNVIIPLSKNMVIDCNHIYGSNYVYVSCLGICKNFSCILKHPLNYDSCQNQYRSKNFTLSSDFSRLSFLILIRYKMKRSYRNDIFLAQMAIV